MCGTGSSIVLEPVCDKQGVGRAMLTRTAAWAHPGSTGCWHKLC